VKIPRGDGLIRPYAMRVYIQHVLKVFKNLMVQFLNFGGIRKAEDKLAEGQFMLKK